jgi:menaquinone-specific isochorismate synthase
MTTEPTPATTAGGSRPKARERSALRGLAASTRLLTWQGRPVQASDVDLVAAAGPDGSLFRQVEFGLAGRGAAAVFALPRGLEDPAALRDVARVLKAVPSSSAVAGPGTGPVVFGALPFDRAAAARLTVPAVVIGRRGPDVWLSRVTGPDVDDLAVAQLEEEMTAAALGHSTARDSAPPRMYTLTSVREPSVWKGLVAAAVERIENGDFEKVVLARQVEVVADQPFPVLEILDRLWDLFPSCMVFKVGDFLGASPELLVDRRGRTVASHPLAGTVGRSGDRSADDKKISELLRSPKERREHAIVVEGLHAALAPLCAWLNAPDEPEVLELRNVCHLATRLTGQLAESWTAGPGEERPEDGHAQPAGQDVPSALELVAAVHPSPAVGGSPGPEATTYLEGVEGFDRGPFAGPVGWMDSRGDGTFAIGLRSAEVSGTRAVICAGVGVVRGSAPALELEETQLKLQALLAALVRP